MDYEAFSNGMIGELRREGGTLSRLCRHRTPSGHFRETMHYHIALGAAR